MNNTILTLFGIALLTFCTFLCGCSGPENEPVVEYGGIDLSLRSNSEHDDEDLVKSWTISSFAATTNKGLSDITWKIRDEGTNQYVFQGPAPLVTEDEAPSNPGVVIYDSWGDGFGSSDRVIARFPDYGNYYLTVHHGSSMLYDTQFWITDSS